jgi:cytochrome P450
MISDRSHKIWNSRFCAISKKRTHSTIQYTMERLFSSSKHAVEGFPMIPNSNVFFGHLLLMRDPDFRRVIEKFSVEHADPHGRCCFWMGNTPALSVTAPQDVQLVLKHSSHRNIFSLMARHFDHFLGKNSIGTLSGREWKTQRTVIVKALHTAVSSESFGIAVVKATQGLVDALLFEQDTTAQHEQQQQQQQQHELGEIMKLLTLDIFGQTAMHADFECCHGHSKSLLQPSPMNIAHAFDFLAGEMMRRMTTGIMDPASQIYSIPTATNRKQAEQRAFLRGYIADCIEERRQQLATDAVDCPQDLLTAMIQVENLSEDELTDTLLSLLFAGYETTAATLTYTIYLISQHASVERHCLEEIERVNNADSAATSTSIKQQQNPDDYPYLQAVLMETLRLYPPGISTTRSLEKELVLDGIPVPKGTYLYIPNLDHSARPPKLSRAWLVSAGAMGHSSSTFHWQQRLGTTGSTGGTWK